VFLVHLRRVTAPQALVPELSQPSGLARRPAVWYGSRHLQHKGPRLFIKCKALRQVTNAAPEGDPSAFPGPPVPMIPRTLSVPAGDDDPVVTGITL